LQVLGMNVPSQESCTDLVDLVTYAVDMCHSIYCLLEMCPQAAQPLHSAALEVRVSGLYQGVLVPLSRSVDKFHKLGLIKQDLYNTMATSIKMARHCLVQSFRVLVYQCCLSPLLHDGGASSGVGSLSEDLLQMMTTALSDKTFLVDYNNKHPIREDLEMMNQAGADIDTTRKHYILDGLVASPTKKVKVGRREAVEPEPSKNKAKEEPRRPAGSESRVLAPVGVEIDSLISTVKDLLPYLGEGFVEQCLKYYDWKVDDVVNALLEGNLPPQLSSLDQSLGREPSATNIDQQPRSVYDEDEFDINSRDHVDASRVHRGKKNKGKSANAMLDDKAAISTMREKFSELGIVQDEMEVMVGEDVGHGYDDEYDDTYDDNPVGPDEVDEMTERRPFVLPRALGGGHIGKQVVIDDDEEEEEETVNRNEFVRNPEEVRAERERAWQHKMSRGRGGRAPPNRDVVGKAKGQGQEKNVLINRARKNANKGKQQRSGADRKQARGMF